MEEQADIVAQEVQHGVCMTEDELEQQHRKEKKELQGKSQQIKHQVPKGDKKRKKEATAEAARLEAEMDERHIREVAELKARLASGDVATVTKEIEELTVGEEEKEATANAADPKKPSKAQKRRDKAAAAARDREERIAEQAKENLKGPRQIESSAIASLLASRGLALREVPADGHCLYAALSHQLSVRGLEHSVASLRTDISNHMRQHCDDYTPFLTTDEGEILDGEGYGKYCDDLENTAAWGGQVEIQAASRVLEQAVEVLQAEGGPLVVGDVNGKTPLVITYHRHTFGLGEHYNSVRPAQSSEQQEDR